MYYVYEWYVKSTGEIFYVGKGTKNRYKVKKHNRFFNDFIKRYDCDSRIVKHFDSEKEAFEYEFERVFELKSKGQCVCNINNGGTGGTTDWWTDKKREEYSRKNVMKSESQRNRMSKNNPMKKKDVAKTVGAKHKKKICIGNKVYDGIVDVAKEYGIRNTAVMYWLKRGYARNQEPCYYYGEKVPNVSLKSHVTNTKSVILDGERYETIKEAAKSIETDPSVLVRALKANRPCKGHKCRYDNQQPSQGKSDSSTLKGSTTNE